MYLKSFRIVNYKSFADSGERSLAPGFNIILGKNNAGKTALLEALSLFPFGHKPHRESAMRRTQPVNPESEIYLEMVFSPQDLEDAMLAHTQFDFPIPAAGNRADQGQSFINEFLSNTRFVKLRYTHNNWHALTYPSHNLFAFDSARHQKIFSRAQRGADMRSIVATSIVGGVGDSVPAVLGQYARQSIYTFQAERLTLSTHPFGSQPKLQPNAQNLAEVLNILQSRSYQFDRFNCLVRLIFPNIRAVSVRPRIEVTNQLEILVWNAVAPPDRDDLAQPLSESGTGIGQVLAMLYILTTANSPQTIIIDEPNTFLHPGATRKLLELMKTAPIQHQFIVTTHSAEIVNMAEPATLQMVSWESERTQIEPLNPTSLIDLRRALFEVGARLSDLFGADHLVWVEGPTEQACFPLIRDHFKILAPPGTEFLPLINTGDLEARRGRAKAIWDIYKQLSTSGSLMPTTLSFGLDRETRTDQEILDLTREAGAIVHFLPRRTYENHLLHPGAIAAVLNTLPSFKGRPIDAATVDAWTKEQGGKRGFIIAATQVGTQNWFTMVNGPKLLEELFQDISEAKESFDKLTHSVELTKWLLVNEPDFLIELADYVRKLIPSPEGSSA